MGRGAGSRVDAAHPLLSKRRGVRPHPTSVEAAGPEIARVHAIVGDANRFRLVSRQELICLIDRLSELKLLLSSRELNHPVDRAFRLLYNQGSDSLFMSRDETRELGDMLLPVTVRFLNALKAVREMDERRTNLARWIVNMSAVRYDERNSVDRSRMSTIHSALSSSTVFGAPPVAPGLCRVKGSAKAHLQGPSRNGPIGADGYPTRIPQTACGRTIHTQRWEFGHWGSATFQLTRTCRKCVNAEAAGTPVNYRHVIGLDSANAVAAASYNSVAQKLLDGERFTAEQLTEATLADLDRRLLDMWVDSFALTGRDTDFLGRRYEKGKPRPAPRKIRAAVQAAYTHMFVTNDGASSHVVSYNLEREAHEIAQAAFDAA
jgi:hypothetical protein